MGERRWARADTATRVTRAVALILAAAAALIATGFMADAALADGFDWLDVLRSALVCVTTAWLAWGPCRR